jgi:hypothetical protein
MRAQSECHPPSTVNSHTGAVFRGKHLTLGTRGVSPHVCGEELTLFCTGRFMLMLSWMVIAMHWLVQLLPGQLWCIMHVCVQQCIQHVI